ncbi:HNH endonuclease [Fictibacillus arsenicus]|uniref:HNH nuclease domain-containing protein n=1 Tax=Fictibacillus arsenicus TaxID=255247 RepID=A0A1V3GAZ1_9BACL|nr:HNH endonuclease [Fictibacillus arsenicus]OOE14033.1 hypothetical protein UN64_02130 [Fictibacillus arsenicus]
MESKQYITVMDKHGIQISKCTKKRAHQLITRQCADWIGWNTLKLRYNREDKKIFRQVAIERDKYTCYICGKVMHHDHPELTADHIIARAKGGSDLPENQACCCKPCNEQKGKMDLKTFLVTKNTQVNF